MPARSHSVGATPLPRSAGLWRVAARFAAAALAVALSIALFSTLARADGALGLEFDSDGGCYVTSNGWGKEPYITGEQFEGSCFVANHSSGSRTFALTMAVYQPNVGAITLGKLSGSVPPDGRRYTVSADRNVLPQDISSGPASVIFTITPSSDRYTSTLHHVIFVAQRNEEPAAYPNGTGPPKVQDDIIRGCGDIGNGPVSVNDEISVDCTIAGDRLPQTATKLTYHVLDSSANWHILSTAPHSIDRESGTFLVSDHDIPMPRGASDGHARLYVEAWTSTPTPPGSRFYDQKTLDWALIPIHINNPAVPGPTDDSDDDSGDDPVDTAPTTTTASSEDVRLDRDGNGLGCQISDADGVGRPTYRRNQQVLLSCPVTNPATEFHAFILGVALPDTTTGRLRSVHVSAKTEAAPQETDRREARFRIPSDWPDGDTIAHVVLFGTRQGEWVEQDRQTTRRFRIDRESSGGTNSETCFRGDTIIQPPAAEQPSVARGGFVSLSTIHKNDMSCDAIVHLHYSITCATGNEFTLGPVQPFTVPATTQRHPHTASVMLPNDADLGPCILNYWTSTPTVNFVEGWRSTGYVDRAPHAQIIINVTSSDDPVSSSLPIEVAPPSLDQPVKRASSTLHLTYKVTNRTEREINILPRTTLQCGEATIENSAVGQSETISAMSTSTRISIFLISSDTDLGLCAVRHEVYGGIDGKGPPLSQASAPPHLGHR